MEGEGTLDLGLPGTEHSEPASNESSWFSISSSLTHLWQTLCWQGRMRGWVNSSLQMGQISSRSMFLIGTWWQRTRLLTIANVFKASSFSPNENLVIQSATYRPFKTHPYLLKFALFVTSKNFTASHLDFSDWPTWRYKSSTSLNGRVAIKK